MLYRALPLLLVAAPAAAQLRVSWAPAEPIQGSLITITVELAGDGRGGAGLTGALAGEPLHFEPADSSRRVALGAVPLGVRDSITVEVVARGRATRRAIAVSARSVERERLRAAPQYVRPPPALAPRIAAERRLVGRVLVATHGRPRLWWEPFLRPRADRVLSGFGTEREFNEQVESRHRGVDLAGRSGTPVRAANRGVVVLARDLYYSGWTIFVDHGAGLLTGYFHLSRVDVAPGDTVARGQVIGRVGATGRVTGPHLHWAAHYGRVAFDPFDLLALEPPDVASYGFKR